MSNNYLIDNKIIYDGHSREISKIDDPARKIKLSKAGAQCLQILIEAKHKVVSQDNLSEYIWGVKGIIVGSNTLYQHIYILRKCLSELGADKAMIRTIPRLGINIPEIFTIDLLDNIPEHHECNRDVTPLPNCSTIHLTANFPAKNGNPTLTFNKVIYYISFILSLTALLLYLYRFHSPYSGKYSYLGQYQNCVIYRYPDSLKLSDVKSKVINLGMKCDSPKKQFLYYSGNKKSRMESIILCDNRIIWNTKNKCKSFHWSGYEQ
ncbi:MAG: winged helix-turn-helix domain-containing protein [Serratia sp. (in: enterobacteria)]|uniref:winged helix-turn-helix domain-containing protein n=1 Tax=Serratia sp. (in: enterobacteria) TaxID=616 RepID=UPI003F31F664